MNKIDIKLIDLTALQSLNNVVSTESNVYHDNEKLYKLYKGLSKYELQKKKTKMYMLEGYDLPNVIIPRTEIVSGNRLVGCSEKYIAKSTPLYDFSKKSTDTNLFLKIVKDSSITLRTIHESEIVVADLNFDNIIFCDNFNHYYIDFESCSLNNISFERTPLITQQYLNYTGCQYEIDYNYDRLSMILCTVITLVGKSLEQITEYEYDNLSEKLQTLKNLRSIFLQLKKNYSKIPEIPYIDEFITKEKSDFKMLKLVEY